jgi:streptomycin 6-kinase
VAAARRRRGRALRIPWELEPAGEPYVAPHSKLVTPVRLPDGTEAVLKVANEDDWESDREPEALRFWAGDGAVRLIDHDPETRSMLIERCRPGTALGTDYDLGALQIAAGLLRQLWRPPPPDVPWRTLAEAAERWARELPERYTGRIVDEAVEGIDMLTATAPEQVLCHQDLHGHNVLRAERRPWLAIDAKPIVGEPAYDTVALVRDAKPSLVELRRRLDALADLLELDRDRMRLWGLVKSLAWDNPDEAELFAAVRFS